MRKSAIFYPLLLLVFWTSLMVTADYVVIEIALRQAWSVNFASTTGKMVQSEVRKGAVSHRGVEIGYNYKVNGVDYTGHRYRYDDRNAAWEYSAAVDAFPRWSARKIYYDPGNPANSVLDPGLDGCDLLLLLFATPLNVVTFALWVTVAQSQRRKPVSEIAGGIPVVKREGETRAQLAVVTPFAAAFAALGASSFFLAFPVVSIGGFTPSMNVMLVVWSLVLTIMVFAFAWKLNRNRSGNYDLRINEASGDVTLPKLGGRSSALTLTRSEILAVSLQRRTIKTPSGDYFSYVPAIDRVPTAAGPPAVKLVTWGWTETKASEFGLWLSEQLGVEFKGVNGDCAP